MDPDQCVWTAVTCGKFSVSSTWIICRQKKNIIFCNKMIWSNFITLRWSIIAWRALNGGLPFDYILQKQGFHLASKCSYCSSPRNETIAHVFVSSALAQSVRKYFENMMHIHSSTASLQLKLMEWWVSKVTSSCMK